MNLEEWLQQPDEEQFSKLNQMRNCIVEYAKSIKINTAFINFLCNSSFFEDPSSTTHHCAYPGGLAVHSWNVYRRLEILVRHQSVVLGRQHYSPETLFICGIGHDLCKMGCYHQKEKWRKNHNGQWESYPEYVWRDDMPLGHGEKSVMILSKYIKLSDEEMLAIRWHMGRFDAACDSYSGLQLLGTAQQKSPLVTALHLADMMATWFDEQEYGV